MPDTIINAGQPLRFEQGGVLRLSRGGTDYAVVNREKGSVQLADGWYESLRYNDRGQMQVPLEGDEQPSTFRATVKLTSADAGGLLALAQTRDTSTGRVAVWTVQLDFPAYKGATTGHRFTCANCYFTRPVQVQEGQEFDTVTIEMESSEPSWTLATY